MFCTDEVKVTGLFNLLNLTAKIWERAEKFCITFGEIVPSSDFVLQLTSSSLLFFALIVMT